MRFLTRSLALAAVIALSACDGEAERDTVATGKAKSDTVAVWVTGDPHVEKDIKKDRQSIAEALRQSEGDQGFDWEVMLILGDFAASKHLPGREVAEEVVRQMQILDGRRVEDIYAIAGNHDASWIGQEGPAWFERFLDPAGGFESPFDPAKRRYPVEGNWERYKFQIGNVLFLMLSDYNTAPRPVGWGRKDEEGTIFQASGAVTRETFDWWKSQVLNNQDKIIVTTHHHPLRGTTTRSKPGGGKGLHCTDCSPLKGEGTGYLYYIVENSDPENFSFTHNANDFNDFLDNFQAEHGRPAIDFWLAGHSHATTPHQEVDGQGLIEERYGVTFVQSSALTFFWGGGVPMSRLIEFKDGSDKVQLRTYLHDSKQLTPRGNKNTWEVGFYKEVEQELTLRHSFQKPK